MAAIIEDNTTILDLEWFFFNGISGWNNLVTSSSKQEANALRVSNEPEPLFSTLWMVLKLTALTSAKCCWLQALTLRYSIIFLAFSFISICISHMNILKLYHVQKLLFCIRHICVTLTTSQCHTANNFIKGHFLYLRSKTSLFHELLLLSNSVNYYQL